MQVSGKRLLILGGTSASLDLVNTARSMGVYTIVVDDADVSQRVSKQKADAHFQVSTTDIGALKRLIAEQHVDGVFCGPSEFNIRNMIRLCEAAGLPCYTNMELWNRCANKDEFTAQCRQFGVDVPEEYDVHDGMTDEELERLDYPVIIKPVDGCSSIGISICRSKEEVLPAYRKAMAASACKRIITERYIENGGEIFGVRYLVEDELICPYLLIDTYVVDPYDRHGLISGFTRTPSKYAAYYMTHMDQKVRAMIRGMHIRKGTVFFQSLPYKDKIYFHEMGYRLSGGMIYKLTEPLMGIHDMKLMIRCALGGPCVTPEEAARIDLKVGGRVGAQYMVPLRQGVIGRVDGLEEAVRLPCVTDFLRYHAVGETIRQEYIGNLQQHFGRFTLIADDEASVLDTVRQIQALLVITDTDGNRMNCWPFDLTRLDRIQALGRQ